MTAGVIDTGTTDTHVTAASVNQCAVLVIDNTCGGYIKVAGIATQLTALVIKITRVNGEIGAAGLIDSAALVRHIAGVNGKAIRLHHCLVRRI